MNKEKVLLNRVFLFLPRLARSDGQGMSCKDCVVAGSALKENLTNFYFEVENIQ